MFINKCDLDKDENEFEGKLNFITISLLSFQFLIMVEMTVWLLKHPSMTLEERKEEINHSIFLHRGLDLVAS